MVIKKNSWHYRFNEWAGKKTGLFARDRKSFCPYFWDTISNVFLLLIGPLVWLLTEPIFDTDTPMSLHKTECSVTQKSGYLTLHRFQGLLFILFLSFLALAVIVFIFAPFLCLFIYIFAGQPDLELVIFSIISIIFNTGFFCISREEKIALYLEMLKNKSCPRITFED